MLGPPGPWVSSRKYPCPQMTLDLLAWILGSRSPGSPTEGTSSKHLPRTDFSGKGRRLCGPGIHVPAPCRDLTSGIEQGLQLPQPC